MLSLTYPNAEESRSSLKQLLELECLHEDVYLPHDLTSFLTDVWMKKPVSQEVKEWVSDSYTVYSEPGLMKAIDKKIDKLGFSDNKDLTATIYFDIAKALIAGDTQTKNRTRNLNVAIELFSRIPKGHPNFAEAHSILAEHAFGIFDPTDIKNRREQALTTLETLCNSGDLENKELSKHLMKSILSGYPCKGTVGNSETGSVSKLVGNSLIETFINACSYLPILSEEVRELEKKKAMK
jgi:hypothetical protein